MGQIIATVDGTVGQIVIADEQRRNAISAEMWGDLHRRISAFSADRDLRCVVLRGAAGHFAGGADIAEFPRLRADRAGLDLYHRNLVAPTLNAISQCQHPTIAAIEGVCIGGGLEIAGRCDLRIGTESSRYGIPINRLGFSIAPDELAGILGLLGRAVTLELLLEGRILNAAEAYAKGILARVVLDADFEADLQETVKRIVSAAPLAQRLNKRLVNRLAPQANALTENEWHWAFSYADSVDHREGIDACLNQRDPRFIGQ